jgi:DNA polymerase-3 subunit gamma/tau
MIIFGRVEAMNLYLKYRPRTIDELDLSGVRQKLTEIVKANNIGHAYLLTGPRGAGKTSTARVLARIVNCEKNGEKLAEPCNKCKACLSILEGSALDVIEIDAASNRGIDDIRELKEKIRLAPAILRKKVYIIDEVHMLTTEAFNALLKTLEEPPAHSLFILCTTELHKVPETIVSRCIQIQFTKATSEEMKRSFARVVKGEGKKATPEALEYLARAVDGSFRDGVKILDQALSNVDELQIEAVQQLVTGSAGYTVLPLLEALVVKDLSGSLARLNEAVTAGVDLNYLLVSVMRGLRDKLVAGEVEVEATKLVFSLDEVARRLATSLDGELLIQVAIVEWCGPAEAGNNQSSNSNNQAKGKEIKKEAVKKVETKPVEKIAEAQISNIDHTDVWQKLMGSLNGENFSMGALLAKAWPARIQGDELTIQVQYGFHRDQIMTEKILAKLEKMVSDAVGKPMRIKCEVSTVVGPASALKASEGQGGDTIDEAIAIFNS